MAPRKNRRVFVAITYASMLGSTLTVLIVPSWRNRFETGWVIASNASYLLCWLVFGTLVKQIGPLDTRGGELTSLGLAPRRRNQDQLDEREVVVRNAACFEAYRVLALYSIAIYFAAWVSFELRASVAVKILELLTMPLLAMALTLPQAALLWREPDVPEEARV
jgi:hypothetical protein